MLPQNSKSDRREHQKTHHDLKQKWQERLDDIYLFSTLLHARANIFIYGSNGCGKTSFVRDTLTLTRGEAVHVDCVEFYSEKLIAIKASQQIYNMIF